MMDEPMTATTALARLEARTKTQHIWDRLFHDLRDFIRVYATTKEAQDALPDDLDVVFVQDVGGNGPAEIISAAIRSCPELWAEALPPECCIVPRSTLDKIAGATVVEAMAAHGSAMVQNHAARFRQQVQDEGEG
jgi:hypothetical protein